MQVKTLILGAGLTGLSTAYHLEQNGQNDYLLVEKEPVCGGLCASTQSHGFTYDYGGHLLHLHTPEGKKLVKKLLKTNLSRLSRNAFIYTHGVRVPYPFQAHLAALPAAVRKECATGLLNRPSFKTVSTFEQWCLAAFGAGIYEHFFKPYHQKIWNCNPAQLTADWCAPFVPVLSAQDIRRSLQKTNRKHYGYNSYFYYPKQGGIGSLAQALAAKISHLQLNSTVTAVDLKRQTAVVNGHVVHYRYLINTLPLKDFTRLLKGQNRLKKQADFLKSVPVTVYHLAIARKVRPFSWLYFPEKDVPFYRVGLQSAFSAHNAPKNSSLFYIELPGLAKNTPALRKKIWTCLVQKGIIKRSDRPVFSAWQSVTHAYVIYDKKRTQVVSFLQNALAQHSCYCGGRYGSWNYSFMESALLEGKSLAQKVK